MRVISSLFCSVFYVFIGGNKAASLLRLLLFINAINLDKVDSYWSSMPFIWHNKYNLWVEINALGRIINTKYMLCVKVINDIRSASHKNNVTI